MKRQLIFYMILMLIVMFRYVSLRPEYRDGDFVRVRGRVSGEPLRYSTKQRITVQGVTAFIDPYPELYYGDKVVFEGSVVGGTIDSAKLISFDRSSNVLFGLRRRIVSFYKSSLSAEHFGLVSGIVLGSKGGIDWDFRERLINSGTIHVVVASGMNVTLFGGFLLNLGIAVMNRKRALVMVFVGIWGYVLVAGAEAPLVRAAIMGSLAFGAQSFGRVNSSMRALFLAIILMLIINPYWAVDLGFVMSFLATLGLILFQPKIDRVIQFVPGIVRQDLSTTLAAQIAVMPVLIGVFGRVSYLSPVANVLVLWTVAPIMIIGMIGGLVGVVFEPLGRLILFLAYPMTTWFLWVVSVFS